MDSWINTPFEFHFVNLKRQRPQNNLPFAISGLTQQGVEHSLENQNNQDATGIIVEEDFVAGIVCDGCSGTNDNLQDSISNNEVGAKLTVRILTKAIRKAYAEKTLEDSAAFVQTVKAQLLSELKSIIEIVCEDNEADKELFIHDFLATTIFCAVMDKSKFIVFHCGDGVIAIDEMIEIVNESGKYLSSNLFKMCCPTRFEKADINEDLKIYFEGKPSEIKSIFLASDGFNEIVNGFKNQLVNFISTERTKNGFFNIKPDFRGKILRDPNISNEIGLKNWLKDDASFVLLKTIIPQEKES
jgi:serine/threonine protein phosphatase PrpC